MYCRYIHHLTFGCFLFFIDPVLKNKPSLASIIAKLEKTHFFRPTSIPVTNTAAKNTNNSNPINTSDGSTSISLEFTVAASVPYSHLAHVAMSKPKAANRRKKKSSNRARPSW